MRSLIVVLLAVAVRHAIVGQHNIAAFAHAFRLHFHVTELPHSPKWHFPEWGIQLRNGPTEGGERASWIRVGNTHVITAAFQADMNLSFTLWHELYEILREHRAFPVRSKRMTREHTERLANLFASHVLMPRDEVRAHAAQVGHPRIDKSATLAARFGVSPQAMRITLRELGLQYVRRQPKPKYY